MNKPTECPICGAPWLADVGCVRYLHVACLNCGAEMLSNGKNWHAAPKQLIDAQVGPVALTRNAHPMAPEGFDRLADDLGL